MYTARYATVMEIMTNWYRLLPGCSDNRRPDDGTWQIGGRAQLHQ